MQQLDVALIGPGRAGTALALALVARGHHVVAVAGRAPDAPSTIAVANRFDARACAVPEAVAGAALVIVATPDAAIGEVGAAIAPALEPAALVVHLAGALGVEALAPIAAVRDDVRLGALHPLQTLPDADTGAARLPGAWAAVDGPPEVVALAEEVGLHPFAVRPEARATYHAAAVVASNHLVGLLGQVERLAADADVPFAAYLPLVEATVANVARAGAAAAITGPVARGDVATIRAHLAALTAGEQDAYRAGARAAALVAGRDDAALREVIG